MNFRARTRPRLDFTLSFLIRRDGRKVKPKLQSTIFSAVNAQRRFSVIIAVARPAINFLRIYGDELFPGVPIVAYGDSDALRIGNQGDPLRAR